ncbi:hypothetical protein HY626_00095 [Candidatus Uhrbacteria bacterium]|nr:hypothetical protein [Candidatus Uhrbacteria bacterium]
MAIKPRRLPEGGSDRSPEEVIPSRRAEAEASPGAAPSSETRSSSDAVDPVAIEAARARAMASGSSRTEEPKEDKKTWFDFSKDVGSRAEKVGKGGLQVLGGSLVVAGYLGYQTSRPVLFTTARALDWIGHKMNSLADRLIDKKFPLLSWIVNPAVSLLDSFAKSLGIDKALAEHLRKNREDRRKLAEKVLKEYRASETTCEKKIDDAASRARRRRVIEEKLGKDVADALGDDVDAAATAAAAGSKATEAPKPVEAVKTT